MADLAAANVTHSFSMADKKYIGAKGFSVLGTVTFGVGSLTVPVGGVPLTKAKMGLPTEVRSLKVLKAVTAANVSLPAPYRYDGDAANVKLLCANITTNVFTTTTVAPASCILTIEAEGY